MLTLEQFLRPLVLVDHVDRLHHPLPWLLGHLGWRQPSFEQHLHDLRVRLLVTPDRPMQRVEAVSPHQRRVDSVFQQHAYARRAPAKRRSVEWIETTVVAPRRVGAVLEEKVGDVELVAQNCLEERRVALRAADIDVHSALEHIVHLRWVIRHDGIKHADHLRTPCSNAYTVQQCVHRAATDM